MSRRSTLPPAWLALVTSYGGVGAFARHLGVSPQAVWTWGRGTRPSRFVVLAVDEMARKKRVASPWV